MAIPQSNGASPNLISQSAYAKSKGVTRQAINDLVKRKVIPLVGGKIDVQIADLKISELDPARSKLTGMAMDAKPAAAVSPAPASPHAEEYRGSKATREKYESLKAKLDYEKALGSVISRDAVGKALIEAGRMLRDSILAVPARTVPQIVGSNDAKAAEQLLSKELRTALESFVKAATDAVDRVAGD